MYAINADQHTSRLQSIDRHSLMKSAKCRLAGHVNRQKKIARDMLARHSHWLCYTPIDMSTTLRMHLYICSLQISSCVIHMPCLHSHWDGTKQEQECEGYICLVHHVLNLFLSHLEARGNMLVNRTQVKGHECLASLFKPHSTLSRSSRTRVWMSTVVHISSHSHLIKSLNECLRRECKRDNIVHDSTK